MNEQENLKSTLSAIFNRKGRDGRYTRLFENMEASQKLDLLKEINLDNDELPVIGSIENQFKWLLITTKRIQWQNGTEVQTLDVKLIRDAVVDFHKSMALGCKKDQMQELIIKTINGMQYSIKVDEGAPFIGVWNALKYLGTRNRQHK
jgi:hypothetical protein